MKIDQNMIEPRSQLHPRRRHPWRAALRSLLWAPVRWLKRQLITIKNEWAAIIPNTARFRNNTLFHEHKTLAEIKQRMKLFDSLTTLHESEKAPLRAAALHLETVVVLKDAAWIATIFSLMMRVLFIGLFVTLCAASLFIPLRFDLGDLSWRRVYNGLGFALSAAFLAPLILMVSSFLAGLVPRLFKLHPWIEIISQLAWLSFILWIQIWMLPYVFTVSSPLDRGSLTAVFLILNMIGFSITMLVSIVVSLAAGYALKRRFRLRHADAVVFDALLRILAMAEESSQRWADLSHKRAMLELLDQAAETLERGLPHRLQSGDIATNIWLKTITAQMATALRGYKRWICVPRTDTQAQFAQHIAANLRHVAAGHWDHLERLEPEQLTIHQSWRSKALAALKTGLIAVIPLAAGWLVQQTSLAFAGAPAEFMKAFGVLWLVGTILIGFDPAFSIKVATFKDVVQSLPLPGNTKP